MTSPFWRFPDVQRLLVDDLEALAGEGRTAIETPADLAAVLPFVRVLRVGGPSDQLNDFAVVDIDVFADSYSAGQLLAEQIRERLTGSLAVSGLDRVDVEVGPRELPWGDGTVRRWGATYRTTARRRFAA